MWNILIYIDKISKYVELDMLTDCQSVTLAGWFLCIILGPYGRPLQVETDCGPEFAGAFKQLLTVHKIKHMLTHPHEPWINGTVKCMVCQIKALLLHCLTEVPELA